jgi:uncharacterized protein YqjF (DUF2071 family)
MIWHQRWMNVLFLHFPVSARQLAAMLPRQLEVELLEGQAWLSYIFFRLQLRPTWLPLLPGLSSLLELNVRTYVRYGETTGIYFLRMYADNALAIAAARWLTPLCYERALMIDRPATSNSRHLECRPIAAGRAALSLDFQRPNTFEFLSAASLDAWLLERYRLFVEGSDGRILTADVEHAPWRVSQAEVTRFTDTLSRSHGMSLSATPALAHFSPGLTARFNAFNELASISRDQTWSRSAAKRAARITGSKFAAG